MNVPIRRPTEAISYLDIHFARLMLKLSASQADELFIASALVSSQTRAGHICLDLLQLEDSEFLREKLGDDFEDMPAVSLATVETVLATSSVVGQPGAYRPLIIDDKKRLYLNRYWQYQNRLADFINGRVKDLPRIANPSAVRDSLDKYFPVDPGGPIDLQRIAAATATLKSFCVITGGPGTGKTYTVGKFLAVLLEQSSECDLKILLAAPTGKAAIRLQDSIRAVKDELDCAEEIKTAIPETAATIHRLLGTIRHSPYFRHNEDNPLEVDVMVVDEASMVDLALMCKLVQALPAHAKLILLGDDNQLASVEAGAVLADICDAGRTHTYSYEFLAALESIGGQFLERETTEDSGRAISDCIVQLKKSYRFEKQRGIGALSELVNKGDGEEALRLMKDDRFDEVQWHDIQEENLLHQTLPFFSSMIELSTIEEILEAFDRLRILCAIRDGPQGANTVNALIEKYVRGIVGAGRGSSWYRNQPVLVTQNDYTLQLYNGDLGVILPAAEDTGDLTAQFMLSDKRVKKLRPFRLPEHETAYALTVHKSQGSEFEKVILLLPEKDSPILTRELIYTAITRATQRVEIWGKDNVFSQAVSRQIKRSSGLRDALWG
ncbi:exodeoxyribonuclease V subunit alpha [bacterium]|nr:exodeoxyribonuclease V subunit alpha [bacterium]